MSAPPLSPRAQHIIEQMPPDKPAQRAGWIAEAAGETEEDAMRILKELRKSGVVKSTRGGWWKRA